MKTCNLCKNSLSFENYSINKANKDGYSNRCKKCLNEVRREKYTPKEEPIESSLSHEKTCKCCQQIKPLEDFGKSKNNLDGRENLCKTCRVTQRKKNSMLEAYSDKEFKNCSQCKQTLKIENFSRDNSRDDGFSAICKPCKKVSYQKYIKGLEARESAKKRSSEWKVKNPDKVRQYYLNNREAIVKRTSEYHTTYKGKYTLFISQAKFRNIECNISLEEYNNIIAKNCEYCDSHEGVGIDRLNSDLGYSSDNVVPCCQICNYGKNTLSKNDFINHILRIKKYQTDGILDSRLPHVRYSGDIKADHYLSPFGQYSRYKNSAKERRLDFSLEYKDFVSFWQKPCNYCGSTIDLVGLDRVDNFKGYHLENVVACCQNCNNLKRNLTLEQFYNQIDKICIKHNK